MLWTLFVALLLVWLLGVLTAHTQGGAFTSFWWLPLVLLWFVYFEEATRFPDFLLPQT